MLFTFCAGVAATGAYQANLSPPVMNFALELAATELKHVQFLRAALGPCAVPAPQIDLSTNAFGTIANLAVGTGGNFLNFDPANDDVSFLLSVFIYEDVGVTACACSLSAFAPSFSDALLSDPDNYAAGLLSSYGLINAATSIMAAEAYHSGAVRSLLIKLQAQYAGQGLTTTVGQIANAISALRGALGTGGDVGISPAFNLTLAGVAEMGTPNGTATVVAPLMVANGLAFSRTPGQVKNIVTGGGGAALNATGLFFPIGLNYLAGSPF